ncbi:M56 family metallopeptidase [Sphingomonas sanxanigenens]|uniref:Peptidase M56 domain-containing protein n=1 Tax=Sphingomonas sanxanigenens DSM 19645 = NX02 TaxID=1123269 RepID=W0A994_9SPHN|nr:M56 family metallopeptidase [Sphingomonas sanxanigenens]AHE52913.1 hypothetical protein NX02_05890 [Sphingomonas sanxanigenens DSM 19645 = NX02]
MSAWIVQTLVATSLLMLIVMLLRERVAAVFGPRIAYLLWLLPALRMVLPPLPRTLIDPPIEQIPVLIDFVSLDGLVDAAPSGAADPLPTLWDPIAALPWGTILLAAWLGGAALHFGWHILAYRRFVRETLSQATPLPRLDRDGIEVCASRAVDGPFATGVFVKTVVLPHDWRWRYSEEELRLALRHEFIHHLRWDLSANFAALALLSLHWFNPIAHRAWRAFRADQELACDALVLAGATPAERHSYGLAVVKSACSRTPVAACTLGSRDELKRRLRMMKSGKRSPGRSVSGAVLAVALLAGGLALTASGGMAAEAAREVVQPIGVALVGDAAAPTEPAPPEAAALPFADMPEPPVAPVAATEPRAPHAAQIASAAPEAPLPPAPPAPPAAPRWADGADAADAVGAAADAAERAADRAERDADRRANAMERVAEARERAMERAADAREWAAERAAVAAERAAGLAEKHAGRHAYMMVLDEKGERRISSDGAGRCAGKGRVTETQVVTRDHGKGETRRVVVCAAAPTEAEVRKLTIDALEKARESLARSRALQGDGLRQALAGLDAELARLRVAPAK